jgi:hypothetical protein
MVAGSRREVEPWLLCITAAVLAVVIICVFASNLSHSPSDAAHATAVGGPVAGLGDRFLLDEARGLVRGGSRGLALGEPRELPAPEAGFEDRLCL